MIGPGHTDDKRVSSYVPTQSQQSTTVLLIVPIESVELIDLVNDGSSKVLGVRKAQLWPTVLTAEVAVKLKDI